MVAWFKGFDLIVELQLRRLKYTGNFHLLLEQLVSRVWPELLNTRILPAPSDCHCYWSGQNHNSYDEIQPTYLFIPPPVTWFQLWVSTFLTIFQFNCWSTQHQFPQHRLLDEELKPFNRTMIEEIWVLKIKKIVRIGQMIVALFAWYPKGDAHWIKNFVPPFGSSVGQSEVADSFHCRIPEKLVHNSSAQVVLDTPMQ